MGGNLVITFFDQTTNQSMPGQVEASGNYSSGSAGAGSWVSPCSTGPGGPVQAYNNAGNGNQVVEAIPYTCAGANYSLTFKATGYLDQSWDSGNLGVITGDVDQTIFMVPGNNLISSGPPGQGALAGLTSVTNTGWQSYGIYVEIGIVVLVFIILLALVVK
jgi:hypothetical protein